MLFMVIERFKGRDPKPIYRRLRDEGRRMPDGLTVGRCPRDDGAAALTL